MKRKQLEDLGLTKEALEKAGLSPDVIDEIMNINGSDIEKAKASGETLQKEVETLKKQLSDATAQIESFSDMRSPDEVKQEIADWKTKVKEAEDTYKQEVARLKRDFALAEALKETYRAKNVRTVQGLLNMDGITFNEETASFAGLQEQMEAIQESDGYLFHSDKKEPRFTTKTDADDTSATPETLQDAIRERLSAQTKKE